ncbi:hypothetical protein MRB53_012728 [Persea americana]|uniref:Uncharacterized protein n=1 Tax=Persea americana TaxID=3435 RepID=A0ACC2LYL5_PERAE|nr:hypothetical protein MRB53_012728 [Persea americana]
MSCREREDDGGARWIRAGGSGRCVQRGDMERDGSRAEALREMKRLDGEAREEGALFAPSFVCCNREEELETAERRLRVAVDVREVQAAKSRLA